MPNRLSTYINKASEDEFWATRGKAIHAYAELEQQLCRLFAHLSGTTHDVARIIFFKITSTKARNSILEKLFKKKFGDRYNLFRNTLIAQLSPIDNKRNEIVHWSFVNHIKLDKFGETISSAELRPPTFMNSDKNSPFNDTEALIAFTHKCNFYSRLCAMFALISWGNIDQMPEEMRNTWLDIFSQSIIYPPPEDHPLSPMMQRLQSQLPSSQV